MASDSDALKRFQSMRIGRSGDRRAPHKPLLALWAIGRCLRGEPRLASYEQIHRELAGLLQRFGPHGRPPKTEYPFWHMRNDGVWEVPEANLIRTTSSQHAFVSDLRRHRVHGGLTVVDYAAFQSNPQLAQRIARILVAKHFPPSLHEEILESAFIPSVAPHDDATEVRDEWVTARRRWRDPAFRKRVLVAYEHQCAVCEFAGRLLNQPLALEAAHIKWHECRGPAVVANGLALCALHHRLFDKGAFTVLPDLEVKVADGIQGAGVDEALGRYDQRSLRAPPRVRLERPSAEFLSWHGREVFKSPETLQSYG